MPVGRRSGGLSLNSWENKSTFSRYGVLIGLICCLAQGAAGIVLTHPESTGRGKTISEERGSLN
jgi:hypothetical protein